MELVYELRTKDERFMVKFAGEFLEEDYINNLMEKIISKEIVAYDLMGIIKH